MKKRKIIIISGLLILSQGILSYETIFPYFIHYKNLYQIKISEVSNVQKVNSNPVSSVQFFSDKPKRKKNDFTSIEKNITLLKKQALSSDGNTESLEFSKIVGVLSGKFLYGS